MFRLFLLLTALSLLSTAHAETLSFKEALDLARQITPDVTVVNENVDASRANALASGRLPDPKLIVGMDNLPVNGMDAWSLSRDFMTMRKIGVMQEWPNHAKRLAERDGADARVAQAEAERRVRLLQIRRDTALAWLNRYYLEHKLELLNLLDRENQLLIDTARAQLAASRGTPAEMADAQQEAAALSDRRDELTSEVIQSKAALERYVGTAAQEPLAGEPPMMVIDTDTLRLQVRHHPELAVYGSMIQDAQAQMHEAQAAKHPDWSVELSYANRGASYSDMVSLQFSIGLPLFSSSRQNPQIDEKLHRLNSLVAERDTMLRDHVEQLEMELAQYTALHSQLARIQNTRIPLAQQKIEYLLADYRGGKASLPQLLSARRELIDLQLRRVELESQHAMAAAKLYYVYGEGAQ